MFNLALDFNSPIFQLGTVENKQKRKKRVSKSIPLKFEWTARTNAKIGHYRCLQNKGELKETTLYGKFGEIWQKNDSTLTVRVWSSNLLKHDKTVRTKMKDKYGNDFRYQKGDEGVFDIASDELAKYVEILCVPKDRGRQLTNAVNDYYRKRGLNSNF